MAWLNLSIVGEPEPILKFATLIEDLLRLGRQLGVINYTLTGDFTLPKTPPILEASPVAAKIAAEAVTAMQRVERNPNGGRAAITPEVREYIKALHMSGSSYTQIGQRCNIHPATAQRILREMGLAKPVWPHPTQEQIEEMCHLFRDEGWSSRAIAKHMKFSTTTVSKHLSRAGLMRFIPHDRLGDAIKMQNRMLRLVK